MTEDEDFKQITAERLRELLTMVMDYFQITTQRYREIMGTLADVKAGQDAILVAVETLIKEGREALGTLKDTGAAGHSAVMDEVIADNHKILEAVTGATGELKAAIATTPLPGQAIGPQ